MECWNSVRVVPSSPQLLICSSFSSRPLSVFRVLEGWTYVHVPHTVGRLRLDSNTNICGRTVGLLLQSHRSFYSFPNIELLDPRLETICKEFTVTNKKGKQFYAQNSSSFPMIYRLWLLVEDVRVSADPQAIRWTMERKNSM